MQLPSDVIFIILRRCGDEVRALVALRGACHGLQASCGIVFAEARAALVPMLTTTFKELVAAPGTDVDMARMLDYHQAVTAIAAAGTLRDALLAGAAGADAVAVVLRLAVILSAKTGGPRRSGRRAPALSCTRAEWHALLELEAPAAVGRVLKDTLGGRRSAAEAWRLATAIAGGRLDADRAARAARTLAWLAEAEPRALLPACGRFRLVRRQWVTDE